jgi:hypothetical protein
MHRRSDIINAIETALATQLTVIAATDAVQEADVPCAVVEEREEQDGDFDKALTRPATSLRRRLRLAIFAFGRNKRERDDVAEKIEALVLPAVAAIPPVWPSELGIRCALVGVGFSRSRLGTSAAAFVAGQFYDAEYLTPTYL